MFLIPKIFYRAGNRVETYRYSHVQSISTIIVACVKNAVHLLNYYFGVCEIPLCFGAAATVLETRHKRTDKANRILLGLVTAAAVYAGFGMILSADRYLGKAAVIQHIRILKQLQLGIVHLRVASFGMIPNQMGNFFQLRRTVRQAA